MQISRSQSSRGSGLGDIVVLERLDIVLGIVQEVGEVLSHLPYIQPLCRIILRFIKIRNEIKANKERCDEIIANVLRKSQMICERLLEIGQSPAREKLRRLENRLLDYESTLENIYKMLALNTTAKSIIRVMMENRMDDLAKCERLMASMHDDILLQLIVDIGIGQVAPAIPEYSDSISGSTSSRPAPSTFSLALPPKPTLMIERDGVLNSLIDTLLDRSPSRIAIMGGQGFGKTSCSLYALHDTRIAVRFGRRYYISCEGISDAQSLLVEIAHALGIGSSKAWANLLSSIQQFLKGEETLICLDNLDRAWEKHDASEKVEDALASISAVVNVSLVVTVKGTRRPASINWSTPYLPPLDKLSLSGAEAIVRDIAGIQIDQFTRLLLQAVEGIPLAITLLSNLLRDGAETSSSLWRRWSYKEGRQNSIMGANVDIERSQTSKIDAAIAISVNSPQMKKYPDASNVLATLSLLPDGFSSDGKHLEELERFLKTEDIHRCLKTLKSLGLVYFDEAVIPHRIRAISPLEMYCHRFLASEISAVSEELTNYYINIMLEIGLPEISTVNDKPKNSSKMDLEIRNVHSLFRRKFTSSKSIPDDILQRLVRASYFLARWSIRMGYMSHDVLDLAIEAASLLPLPRAFCRLAQSTIYCEMGRFEDAENLSRLALNAFQSSDDLKGQENALATLATIFKERGNLDLADATLLQSKELKILNTKQKDLNKQEEAGKAALSEFKIQNGVAPHHIAYIYLKLGIPSVYMNTERLENAMGYLNRALELYAQIDHAMGQGTALFHMAYAYLLQNQLDRARATVQRGQTFCHRMISQISTGTLPSAEGMMFTNQSSEAGMQAVFLNLMCHICMRQDRLDEAKEILKTAVKKKLRFSINPTVKLGWLYIQQNRLDKAEKVLSDVLKLCRKWKYTEEESEILGYLGIIYLHRDNLDAAERTLNLARNRGLVLYIDVDIVKALGDVHIRKGNLKIAEELLKHTMYMQKHINSSFGQGNVFRSMGDLYMCQGKLAEAMAAYQDARKLHQVAHWISEEVKDVEKIGNLYRQQGKFRDAEDAFADGRRLKAFLS